MTSQLGACSHGRLVVSAYAFAKPDSPRTNPGTDNPFMGARSRFQLQLYTSDDACSRNPSRPSDHPCLGDLLFVKNDLLVRRVRRVRIL